MVGLKKLGVVSILVGVCIFFGWDKDIESYIIDQGYFGVTSLEEQLVDQIRGE